MNDSRKQAEQSVKNSPVKTKKYTKHSAEIKGEKGGTKIFI